jgi:hypothetical protein
MLIWTACRITPNPKFTGPCQSTSQTFRFPIAFRFLRLLVFLTALLIHPLRSLCHPSRLSYDLFVSDQLTSDASSSEAYRSTWCDSVGVFPPSASANDCGLVTLRGPDDGSRDLFG